LQAALRDLLIQIGEMLLLYSFEVLPELDLWYVFEIEDNGDLRKEETAFIGIPLQITWSQHKQ